jgi:protein SCO1
MQQPLLPLSQLLKPQRKSLKSKTVLSLFILFFGFMAHAYDPLENETQNNDLPKQIEGVGITEQLGKDLSILPVILADEEGNKKPLKEYLTRQRPVILSLVYFSCPSLCNLHLNAVIEALKNLSLVAGKDYDLLAVSFDPKEDSDLAAAKKYTYQEKFQFPENGKGIHFLTGDETSLKTLAAAIGFKYKWDEQAKEWAHASAAVILTPDGVISRYLHGVYFEPRTFRLSLVEASKGVVGGIVDSVTLFCFRYDPKASKYSLYAFNLMRAGAGIAVLLLLIWLLPNWIRSRRKRR